MLVRALPVLIALMLSGCSMTEWLPDSASQDPGPEPVVDLDIGNRIADAVGASDRRGRLEVSTPRRSDSDKGQAWLYCVKAAAGGMGLPQYYAVFIRDNKVVQSRLSVLIDRCEIQSFAALKWTPDLPRSEPPKEATQQR